MFHGEGDLHEVGPVAADQFPVDRGARVQQPLQSVGRVVAHVLRKLPAVLAPDRAQQSAHVVPYPPPRLHARETFAQPPQQRLQFHSPGPGLDIRLRTRTNAPRSSES